MSDQEILVSLHNAGIFRDDRWLVRSVDMEIREKEIVTLIGPNGSGKSTTAKLMTGILSADEGHVKSRPGLKVSYVPQKLAIDWSLPLTVSRFMQLTRRMGKAEVLEALTRTGVPHLIDSQMRTLSGGEFQRVMLARVLNIAPDLLVLDEPVQGVDFAGQVELYELIGAIRDSLGCGILLISHDLHVVMAQTDRVVCFNGHVCCQGTPETVVEKPEYLSLFGGKAAGAFAVYHHQHDHTHLPDGRVRHADGSVTDNCHPGDGHHEPQSDGKRTKDHTHA